MAYQLIYTSVSRGLIPGRSGYTVAARHRQIRERLVSDIERISGYTFSTSGVSPVIYAHRRISCSGIEYHILTRNMDAGSDYTGRTNHLAHHLVCEPEEIAGCGASPAEILHGFKWRESYGEEPRYLEDGEIIDLGQFAGTFKLPARNWQGVRGEAGDAALLIDDKGKPTSAFVVASSGEAGDARNLLAMYAESLHLATSVDDTPAMWKAAFTTYLQQVDTLADFDWAGCTEDHSLLQRPGNRLVLNLSVLGLPTPSSKQAKLAATGRVDPPPPPHRPTVDLPRADSSQPSSPVPQPDVGVKAAQQARRVTFTPVNTRGQRPGPVQLPGTNPLSPQSVSTHLPGESKLDFLRRPENLRLVIGGGAAAVLVLVLLFYYLFSVHPRQDFESEVKGHIANHYWQGAMDAIDEEKENHDVELIGELRRQVIMAMLDQAEKVNERFASEKGENVKELQDEVSRKIKALEEFEEEYDLSNEDIEDLAARFEGIKKTKTNAGSVTAGNPGLASSGKETSPGDVPETKEKLPDKEVITGHGKNPPPPVPAEKEQILPNAVYLFLNQEGKLRQMVLKEDWSGKGGEKKNIPFRHYVLGSGDSFLRNLTGGREFSYDFIGTGKKEFPIQGANGYLNINVDPKGYKQLTLSKPGTEGNREGMVDVWSGKSSSLLVLGGKDGTSHVLLWNGEEFKSRQPIVKKQGNRMVLNDSLWKYLLALKPVDGNSSSSRAIPQKVYLKFPAPEQGGFGSSDRIGFPLQDQDRSRLGISFEGGDSREIGTRITDLEDELEEHEEWISCLEWTIGSVQMKEGLKRMGNDCIEGNFDKTPYPQIFEFKSLEEEDFRKEVIRFVKALAEGLPDVLDKDKTINVDDIKFALDDIFSWDKFTNGVGETIIDGVEQESPWKGLSQRFHHRIKSKEFIDLMEKYPEYLNKAYKKKLLPKDRNKIERKVDAFTKQWLDQLCGRKGRFLWDYAGETKRWRREIGDKPGTIGKLVLHNEQRAKKSRKQFLDEKEEIEGKIRANQKKLRGLSQSEGSRMLPGVYQLMLVFDGATQGGEDRVRPFVIWTSLVKEGP
ncbi:MAG: hypothetical protein VCA55_11435 [Verrucomicrobiales bacterium]